MSKKKKIKSNQKNSLAYILQKKKIKNQQFSEGEFAKTKQRIRSQVLSVSFNIGFLNNSKAELTSGTFFFFYFFYF